MLAGVLSSIAQPVEDGNSEVRGEADVGIAAVQEGGNGGVEEGGGFVVGGGEVEGGPGHDEAGGGVREDGEGAERAGVFGSVDAAEEDAACGSF